MTLHYHAHLYFDERNYKSASSVREALFSQQFPGLRVFPLVTRPIGPHPLPMFEIHFTDKIFLEVKAWLEKNRGNHTVLIHEETGFDHRDHSEGALWLGPPLSLDFSIFHT